VRARAGLLLLVCAVSCGDPCNGDDGGTATPIPAPDPLEAAGDRLYEIYRRGLIARHIADNGRLLERLALEHIDEGSGPPDAEPAASFWAQFDGKVSIDRTWTYAFDIPFSAARYSMEKNAHDGAGRAELWVPLIAPLKNTGKSNGGNFVVSGGGDNPGYYGGLALAMFSLEAKYKVSQHSLVYARKLVEFFLASELPFETGVIVRRAHWHNSKHNPDGGPLLRGASPEELIGIMLGLMYYLRVEPDDAFHARGHALRERVLEAVAQGDNWVPYSDYYTHPALPPIDDGDYWVKHFEYVLRASAGKDSSWTSEYLWHQSMTALAGNSGVPAEALADFWNWMMYPLSIILFLDGDVPTSKKEEYAKLYMDGFVHACITAALSVDSELFERNALLAASALLANKWLPDNDARDPFAVTPMLEDIWGGDFAHYESLIGQLHIIAEPSSTHPWPAAFQHNLPLAATNHSASIDHNPEKDLGSMFGWKNREQYWFEGRWDWDKAMPGWTSYSESSWASPGTALTESQHVAGSSKARPASHYAEHELASARHHHDTQVEGVGLDLTFLRMFLSHLSLGKYPPPILSTDPFIPWLPYPGVEPLSLPRWVPRARTHDDDELGGDRPKALRIEALVRGAGSVIVASAAEDDTLVMSHFKLIGDPDHPRFELQQRLGTDKVFDQLDLLTTLDSEGRDVVVVVQRAEDKRTARRDPHWMRITIFRITSANRFQQIGEWDQKSPQEPDDVEFIDAHLASPIVLAVMSKTGADINRIRTFDINPATGDIAPVSLGSNVQEGTDHNDLQVHLAAVESHVVYASEQDGKFRLHVRKLTGSTLGGSPVSSSAEKSGELLDLAVIQRIDRFFAVAGSKKDDHLDIWSWELEDDGQLTFRDVMASTDADGTLSGQEKDYDRLTIKPAMKIGWGPFVIAGNGRGLVMRDADGDWTEGHKALKVLDGHIMSDGTATIDGFNLFGVQEEGMFDFFADFLGDGDSLDRMDVSRAVCIEDRCGVVTAHSSKDGILNLVYWERTDRHVRRFGDW
jgi:hypothetical protein